MDIHSPGCSPEFDSDLSSNCSIKDDDGFDFVPDWYRKKIDSFSQPQIPNVRVLNNDYVIKLIFNDDDKKSITPTLPSTRFKSKSKNIIIDWLTINSSNPYPSMEIIGTLSRKSGMSIKQIRTFLVNYRARYLKGSQNSFE